MSGQRIVLQRQLRTPSERNLKVYEQVRMLGTEQAEVARQCGITQGRVSQICSQVERWQAQERTALASTRDKKQRRTTLLWCRRQYEQTYAWAMRELVREQQARAATGDGGGAPAPRSNSAGLLNVAIRVSNYLHQMDERERRASQRNPRRVVDELDALLVQVAAAMGRTHRPDAENTGPGNAIGISDTEAAAAARYECGAPAGPDELSGDRQGGWDEGGERMQPEPGAVGRETIAR